MATLKFVFNEEKVKAAGKTVDELMKPIREKLRSEGAEEIDPLVFSKTGKNSITTFTILVVKLTEVDHTFINLLDEWTLDAEGEIEDCIKETQRWYDEKGIQYDK